MKYKFSAILCFTISLLLMTEQGSCTQNRFLDQDPITRTAVVQGLYTSPELIHPLYQMTKDVTELMEKHGINHWGAFGTLLGAIRNKGVIPWDDDSDCFYDIQDETKLLGDAFAKDLKSLGYVLKPEELLGYKIVSLAQILNPKTNTPVQLFVDLFACELKEGKYILAREKARATWPAAWFTAWQIENKQKVPFGEFSLYLPKAPETYALRAHGPHWATIGHYYCPHHEDNKGVNYIWTLTTADLKPAQPTGPLLDRVAGLSHQDHAESNIAYWNQFYAHKLKAIVPQRLPSSFCQYVIGKNILKAGSILIDIGCGNGRDTFEFGKHGIKAIGLDSSSAAVETNLDFAKQTGAIAEVDFKVLNAADQTGMAEYLAVDNIYARFFLHAITPSQQQSFEEYLKLVKTGAMLLLEFRTDKDPLFDKSTKVSSNEGKTDHYRRFINFAEFCTTLERLNYTVIEKLEADNLSVTQKQDEKHGTIIDNPYLGRIIAVKK